LSQLGEEHRLYLIADSVGGNRPLVVTVREAVKAGVRLVQLREKHLSHEEYLVLAREIRRVTKEHGALLLVNSRLDAAVESQADGVHLTRSGSVAEARRELGPSMLVGVSTHSAEELQRAEEEGADFVVLSPIFPPRSKPSHGPALGLAELEALAKSTSVPVYALGGIGVENALACLDAGAFGVAVVGAVMAAEDVPGEVRAIRHVLGSGAAVERDA
jgi:thiamine-phosphate pyrophosphorylase